jgi:hypothetical protein
VTAAELPWSVLSDYHCFGCSPTNPGGLGLTFTDHPAGDGPSSGQDGTGQAGTGEHAGLATSFRLGRGFESYPGVVHGGLLGVVCVVTMGNLIVVRTGLVAFTISLRLRYLSPALVGAEYTCVARLGSTAGPGGTPGPARRGSAAGDGPLTAASADILDAAGSPVVTASATYRTVPLGAALDRIALPSPDATRLDHALSATAGRDSTAQEAP